MYAYLGKQTNTIPAELEDIKKAPSWTGLLNKMPDIDITRRGCSAG